MTSEPQVAAGVAVAGEVVRFCISKSTAHRRFLRWHLSCGIAHPHGDGSTWCRIPHAVLCPARSRPSA
ncbi:transposase family protein [Streptomyces formicae]|nr:transposase family protein [Streptomyces formicae]